ncbi:MAG: glycosyltransferase [Bacteroidia bacterium]|nr:glycosyltransferase [Bacteroidia bacterium]
MQTLYSSLNKLFLFFDSIRLLILSHVDPRVFEAAKYVIVGLFGVMALIQVWHYWFVFRKVGAYKKTDKDTVLPPTSVIICAKNEDDNLTRFLPQVLDQDYPDYEVIVVNDCSYDNTGDVLEEFAKKYARLKIVTIKEDEYYRHGKKFALMCGIKGAKNECLLLTDADCRPAGNKWLRSMMSNYTDDTTSIVLGYGAYEKEKGVLNKIIRFDTFYIALQYLSFSLNAKTYMGVGRNLSYRKSLFFKHKGFGSHYFLESGDDDLFINEAATATNTKVELGAEGITYSKPKATFKEWYHQKRRHITTYKYYKRESIRQLSLLTASQYGFWMLFVAALFTQIQPIAILSVFGVRLLSQLFIFKKAMDRLGERDLLLFSPVFEVFLLFVYPAFSLSNTVIKENKWKS